MTLSLGSVVAYGALHVDDLRHPLGHRAFVADGAQHDPVIVLAPSETPNAAAPATSVAEAHAGDAGEAVPPSSAHAVNIDGAVRLTVGMTSDRVFSELGEPDAMSADGARWTYGSTTLIFNQQERLTGRVWNDPVQAALNNYNNVIASAAATEAGSSKGASKSATGPKILRYKPARPTQASKQQRFQPPLSASSRDGRYRYDSLGQNYSYYMGRSGPQDRFFHRKTALPRGMSSGHRRNHNATFGTISNHSRSRINSSSNSYRR
jgi:hypothetical protein